MYRCHGQRLQIGLVHIQMIAFSKGGIVRGSEGILPTRIPPGHIPYQAAVRTIREGDTKTTRLRRGGLITDGLVEEDPKRRS